LSKFPLRPIPVENKKFNLIYSSYGQEKENSLLDEGEAREENEATKYIKDIVNSYEEMVKNSENRNFQFNKNANREQVKSKSLINDRQERDKRIRYSVSPTNVYHNQEQQQQQQHMPRQPVLSPTLKKIQHNVSFSPEHHTRNIFYSTLDPGKSYFAQAIGQGQLQGQRVNLNSDRKRVRSSSSTCRTTSTNANQRISERDYKGLLNLAQKISSRDRSNQAHTADIPRSLSVNYLYNKRQGDLRRCQNKNLQVQIDFNHNGFTTEDIDDIYMPKKFELFERKLKASIDMSDNSEQEECNFRRKRFSYLKNNNNRVNVDKNNKNKRLKHDTSEIGGGGGGCFSEPVMNNQKILVNYQKNNSNNSKNSYLEEAKRKLSEMRSSKNAYFHNLNNKIKSSVTNVVKASQDLESRNSGLQRTRLLVNRKLSLHELYDIRKDQIRTNNANNSNNNNSSFTSDDIDSVYMPWMMENYGRKLAIEALKRRNNMQDSNNIDNPHLNVHLKTNVKFKNNQKKYQGFLIFY
jgi:hypothetical protein